jgi:transcription termination/antitermination protein NusG
MTLIQQAVQQTVAHQISQDVAGNLAWYAIQTMPRHERKVAAELQRKDLQTFLPLFPSTRHWSDRMRVLEMPLFPGYVFVQMSPAPDMRISVLRTSGVTSFVGVRGVGVPIPESQIAAVERVLEQRLQCSPYPFLNIGQRVRLRGGSLEGIEGILTEIKGDQSLVISVELIQRSLAIRVAGYRIEPI